MIKIDDYIEGYEFYGDMIRKIKGWVDKVYQSKNGNFKYFIQADDEGDGYRGTIIVSELGDVFKLESKPRPII